MKLKHNYLKLIIGPMFSGKSSFLLSEIKKYSSQKILVVNNILDKKRSNECVLKTHDAEKFPAIMIKHLYELKEQYSDEYNNCDVVLIDESQFFSDLFCFIEKELKCNKHPKIFIIAGLSADYNMQPIGDIIKLVPLADDILKLNSYCTICNDNTIGNFTKLKKNNSKNTKPTIFIGAKESYHVCCRFHFYNEDEDDDLLN